MSSKIKAKHNTTRSGTTKDKRPPKAQKQATAALDPTGGNNPISTLATNKNRGQTLGSGPWGQQNGFGEMQPGKLSQWASPED